MKYLMILLLSSCSILNHSSNPEVEQRNREKRAVVGIICIGAMFVVTVTLLDRPRPQ